VEDIIFIKSLVVETIIGIYPHEQAAKQPIVIDIDLYTDFSAAGKTGLIKDTVDYDLVVKKIKNVLADDPGQLLETIALKIVDALIRDFKVAKVRCKISKPQAIPSAQAAGVCITRMSTD
jgi:dihydroneopterin aldolase